MAHPAQMLPRPVKAAITRGAYALARLGGAAYASDGMILIGKNAAFLQDPVFRRAYRAGIDSGHRIGGGGDLGIQWRVATCLWAAAHARNLPGDFVECGVNTGIMSLAICERLGFGSLDRRFWLLDTFEGIPPEQMSATERADRTAENAAFYGDCHETARRNFAPYPNARLVRGRIPDTLPEVEAEQVAYLHIDLNIAAPERAAIEHFWSLMSPSGVVILDDYGWQHYAEQKASMDEWAAGEGVPILNLPTGQGLLVKPGY